MDKADISTAIVSLSSPGIQGIIDKDQASAAAAAVNDNISKIYTRGNYSDRFGFFCSVALQDPSTAAVEAKRCVEELGGVGVAINGYSNNGSISTYLYLDNPSNEPFWAALEDLGVPLYLHPRTPPSDQQVVYQDYNFLAGSPWGFSGETAAHALRLMISGLFDQHPTLNIILGHCGEGIPSSLYRIDQRLRHFGLDRPWPAQKSIQHYFESNFYITTSGTQSETTLSQVLLTSSEDRVLFSMDYPYEDYIEISAWFDKLAINENTKAKIGFRNARQLLKSLT